MVRSIPAVVESQHEQVLAAVRAAASSLREAEVQVDKLGKKLEGAKGAAGARRGAAAGRRRSRRRRRRRPRPGRRGGRLADRGGGAGDRLEALDRGARLADLAAAHRRQDLSDQLGPELVALVRDVAQELQDRSDHLGPGSLRVVLAAATSPVRPRALDGAHVLEAHLGSPSANRGGCRSRRQAVGHEERGLVAVLGGALRRGRRWRRRNASRTCTGTRASPSCPRASGTVELRDGRQCRAGASVARGRRDVDRWRWSVVTVVLRAAELLVRRTKRHADSQIRRRHVDSKARLDSDGSNARRDP
jgi:hypothetical protein